MEEIPGTALAEGIPWTWESFPEYMDALDEKERDIDVAVFLPHGPLRVYVMGERGVNRETATEDDIREMKKLLKEGVDAGAVGLSSSRTLVHLSSSGDHVPTFEAAANEMKELGTCLSGDKGQVMQFISDFKDAEEEFSILRETSAKTGAKGTFTLVPINSPSEGMNQSKQLWKEHLERIDDAQAHGLDIRGQVITRPIGILMGHPASMSPFYRRPTFLKYADLPWDERIAKLKEPEVKAQILKEENDNPHIFVQLLSKNFNAMYPMEEPINYLPESENCVAQQAGRADQDPIDWLYDFFLGNNGTNLIYIPATSKSKAIISELLKHPHTVTALGDGGRPCGLHLRHQREPLFAHQMGQRRTLVRLCKGHSHDHPRACRVLLAEGSRFAGTGHESGRQHYRPRQAQSQNASHRQRLAGRRQPLPAECGRHRNNDRFG